MTKQENFHDQSKRTAKITSDFQLAESSPETAAIREALANPSVGAALEKMTGDGLARMHHREVAAFRQRELNAFWSKENAKAERKQKLSATSTNTISEQELLKIVGRGGESQQANSAWILRRIEAAKSDPMAFPPFVQIGRHRRYHVDSVKAWLSLLPVANVHKPGRLAFWPVVAQVECSFPSGFSHVFL